MKRVVTSLLAVLMVLSMVISGCGKSNNEAEGTSGQASSAPTSANATEAPKEPVKLKVLTTENWNPQNSYANGLPVLKEIEKRANVIFEWELLPPGELLKVVPTRVAAGSQLPDIMNVYVGDMQGFSQFAASGLFTPLNDLIDQYAPNIKRVYEVDYPFLKKRHTMADGNIYDIKLIEDDEIGYFQTNLIRSDWLEKVGMKMPETTEEFYQALKAFQEKDVNGNGKKDEVWCASAYQMVISFQGAFGSTVKKQWDKFVADDNGKVNCPWTSNEILDTYKYLNKLYTEGLIDPEILSVTWEQQSAKMSANKVAATMHLATSGQRTYNALVKNFNGNYQVVPQLKGPSGTYKLPMVVEPASDNGYHFAIPKESKKAEAAIKLMDYLYSKEGIMLTNYGLEGTHYTLVDGKPVFKPEFETVDARNAQGIDFGCLPKIKKVAREESYKMFKLPAVDIATFESMFKNAFIGYEAGVATKDEADQITAIGVDVWNYIDEMRVKFIIGKEPLSNWDKYVAKCNELGLDKLTELEQKAYDRFTGK